MKGRTGPTLDRHTNDWPIIVVLLYMYMAAIHIKIEGKVTLFIYAKIQNQGNCSLYKM